MTRKTTKKTIPHTDDQLIAQIISASIKSYNKIIAEAFYKHFSLYLDQVEDFSRFTVGHFGETEEYRYREEAFLRIEGPLYEFNDEKNSIDIKYNYTIL